MKLKNSVLMMTEILIMENIVETKGKIPNLWRGHLSVLAIIQRGDIKY